MRLVTPYQIFVRSARCVSFHSPDGLDSTHFAGGADDTMFRRSVHSATNELFSCPENILPIIRVHHFANHAMSMDPSGGGSP